MKRTRYEVFRDILAFTVIPQLKTHIVYKCNLNFKMVNEYIRDLIERGYIRMIHIRKNKTFYETTDSGLEYLNMFKKISMNLEITGDGAYEFFSKAF